MDLGKMSGQHYKFGEFVLCNIDSFTPELWNDWNWMDSKKYDDSYALEKREYLKTGKNKRREK